MSEPAECQVFCPRCGMAYPAGAIHTRRGCLPRLMNMKEALEQQYRRHGPLPEIEAELDRIEMAIGELIAESGPSGP